MKAKEQALEAISTARKMLASPEPLSDMQIFQLRGLLEYAEGQVTDIQEVKRTRNTKPRPDFVNNRGE
jgi:hypothetical protein